MQLLDGLASDLQRVSSSSFSFLGPMCTLRSACESAWRISSARVIAIPFVSNSHQIFYDMTISQRRSRGCLRLIVIKPSYKSRINLDVSDISAGAGLGAMGLLKWRRKRKAQAV